MLYDDYLVLLSLVSAVLLANLGIWIKLSNMRHDIWTTTNEIRKLQEHINFLQDDLVSILQTKQKNVENSE